MTPPRTRPSRPGKRGHRPGRGTKPPTTEADLAFELPPLRGAMARTVLLGDDEYLILTIPVPEWDMPEHLTDAERAVASAVLRGATNEQIARDRRTSVHTVGNQLTSIFAKLGVTSRIELAHRLRSKGRRR